MNSSNFAYINPALLRMLDCASADEFRFRWQEFMPPPQPDGRTPVAAMTDIDNQLLRLGSVKSRIIFLNARKEPVPCEITSLRIENGIDNAIAFIRDLRGESGERDV